MIWIGQAMNTDNWIKAVLALRKAERVVVFTGAGMSAESGIPTFRDTDGFWKRFPPQQFANWDGLAQTALFNPRSVAEFVLNVIEPIAHATPNAGHLAVAQLQSHVDTKVVTQNIDSLHQSAGSKMVFEIHGSLLQLVDTSNWHIIRRFQREELAAITSTLREYIDRQGSVDSLLFKLQLQFPFDWCGRHRPNIVLFGEGLAEPAWTNSGQAVNACDVLLVVGTSGEVYPAARLPSRAAANGATVISIDPQPCAGCWLAGTASAVLPALVKDAFLGG
jgi:NAD-dependent deacetylase